MQTMHSPAPEGKATSTKITFTASPRGARKVGPHWSLDLDVYRESYRNTEAAA